MDLMNLGRVSRKTGLKAKQTSKRESNGMEDLDEFFQNESDSDNEDTETSPRNGNISRRLSFAQTYKSPRRSMTSAPSNPLFVPTSPPARRKNQSSEFLKNAETLSPIDSGSKMSKNSSSLTKKMALAKSQNRNDPQKKKPARLFVSDDESDEEDQEEDAGHELKRESVDVADSPEAELIAEDPQQEQEHDDSLEDGEQADGMIPVRVSRKRSSIIPDDDESPIVDNDSAPDFGNIEEETAPIQLPAKKKRASRSTKAMTPVPENEHFVRRSTRHRIPTLAFWKNEKVIYNSTKENGAFVREVKDVLKMPETETQRPSRASSTAPRRKTTVARKSRTSSTTNSKRGTDIESQEEEEPQEKEEVEDIPRGKGSEWYKSGILKLDVYEGPGSDKKIERKIAWTPNTESYLTRNSGADNFNLAILFDHDRQFAAAGMLKIPFEGAKAMKNNEETYFMFYVVKGSLEITINDNKFFAYTGCSFEVPMGNMYQILNVGRGEAKLFFVQAKLVTIDPNEEWD